MKQVKRFRDIESDEIVTVEQLYDEYVYNITNGYCEPCLFEEYIINCVTINNGTLEEA